MMTEAVLAELLVFIRARLASLFKVSECIALLDFLCSLTTFVTLGDGYVRPNIVPDGQIAIKQGRHPIKERSSSSIDYVPNDVYIDSTCSLQIITGPNMSGKSTLIRQVALTAILAHIGCFVPAEYASFPSLDQVFSRVSTEDSLAENQSTFLKEMYETSYIVHNAGPSSLVIIDELGRSTSNHEGPGIAWAVCEYLLFVCRSSVLCVSHWPSLSRLATLYTGVVAKHMNVESSPSGRYRYLYKLTAGESTEVQYGLRVAQAAGLPEDVLAVATSLSNRLHARQQEQDAVREEEEARLGAAHSVADTANLIGLMRTSSLPAGDKRRYLANLQAECNAKFPLPGPSRTTE